MRWLSPRRPGSSKCEACTVLRASQELVRIVPRLVEMQAGLKLLSWARAQAAGARHRPPRAPPGRGLALQRLVGLHGELRLRKRARRPARAPAPGAGARARASLFLVARGAQAAQPGRHTYPGVQVGVDTWPACTLAKACVKLRRRDSDRAAHGLSTGADPGAACSRRARGGAHRLLKQSRASASSEKGTPITTSAPPSSRWLAAGSARVSCQVAGAAATCRPAG